MRTELCAEREVAELASWRRDQLVASGFPLPLATRLAADQHYDLHGLIELAESGCPPGLAARILAPADSEGSA